VTSALGKSPAVLLVVTHTAWKKAQPQLAVAPTLVLHHPKEKANKEGCTPPLKSWSGDSLSPLCPGSKYSNPNMSLG